MGIVGLGYVGLPLALAFSEHFQVLGFDMSPELIQALRRGEASGRGVERHDLLQALDSRFVPTADIDRLSECDVIIIAVGTPLTEGRDPDLSQVISAAGEIARRLRPGQLIVLESTTYPGTTDEILVPELERSGLRAGVDFGVAYSPERIDPGNPNYHIQDIPKLVGGIDPTSARVAHDVYARVVKNVVRVSHARVAEAAKMIENLFRSVNIALVNEIALIMERLGIDAWEAIEAAATKPFGFMAFYPGPGVGGHCIPLDPFYLSYRARKAGYMPRFIETSGEVNEYMKYHTVHLLSRGLREAGKTLRGSTVAILGIAFKKNVSDTRESPAIRVIDECLRDGAHIRAYDPHAASISTREREVFSEIDIESALSDSDAAVILVDHDEFRGVDFDRLTELMRTPAVWVDTRGLLTSSPKGAIGLGVGRPGARLGPVPALASARRDSPAAGSLESPLSEGASRET